LGENADLVAGIIIGFWVDVLAIFADEQEGLDESALNWMVGFEIVNFQFEMDLFGAVLVVCKIGGRSSLFVLLRFLHYFLEQVCAF
jgi:hypothetical protein